MQSTSILIPLPNTKCGHSNVLIVTNHLPKWAQLQTMLKVGFVQSLKFLIMVFTTRYSRWKGMLANEILWLYPWLTMMEDIPPKAFQVFLWTNLPKIASHTVGITAHTMIALEILDHHPTYSLMSTLKGMFHLHINVLVVPSASLPSMGYLLIGNMGALIEQQQQMQLQCCLRVWGNSLFEDRYGDTRELNLSAYHIWYSLFFSETSSPSFCIAKVSSF